MKFAAPVLLGASRGGGEGSDGFAEAPYGQAGLRTDRDDEVCRQCWVSCVVNLLRNRSWSRVVEVMAATLGRTTARL